MARYIDADKAIDKFSNATAICRSIRQTIDEVPTVDLAPKSEVAREIFAGIKLRLQNMADTYGYKATLEPDFDQKKEYRGAQIGVSVALHSIVAYEVELEKKYTYN